MEQIVILSGPPSAEVGAVAAALCERYDRMLHIDVPALQRMVVAGFRPAWATDAQALEQRALSIRNACAIAREATDARYAVVIEDAALAAQAQHYRAALGGITHPVHWVTLLPATEAAPEAAAASEAAATLRRRFVEETADGSLPGIALTIAPDEPPLTTADRVVAAVARGVARVATEDGALEDGDETIEG